MSRREYEERRNARIRELREQREGPMRRRRRIQPLLLLMWILGTIALLGVLIVLGFNAIFAPRVMSWVEENPGAIEHGIVRDFVGWYQPEALADEPASTDVTRVTVTIPDGANETTIGEQLFAEGLISSRIAFHYAIISAGREGTIAAGTFDLSPTLRPSEIVATLQGQEFGPVDGHHDPRGPPAGGGRGDLRRQRDDDEHGAVRRRSSTTRRRGSSTSSRSWLTCLPAARWRGTSGPTRTNSRSPARTPPPTSSSGNCSPSSRRRSPTRSWPGSRRRG